MDAIRYRPVAELDRPAIAEVLWAAMVEAAFRANASASLCDPEAARLRVDDLFEADPSGGVLAEEAGRVVAVGWLHPRGRVATVGPIAVRPNARGRGLGAAMLTHLLHDDRARPAQLRHLHDGFDQRGLEHWLGAGFRIVATVLEVVLGASEPAPETGPAWDAAARVATPGDRWQIVERDARAFGARRSQDVERALACGRVMIAERGGRPVGHLLARRVGEELWLGSASADDAEVVLGLVAAQCTADVDGHGVVRLLAPATDQALVQGLLAAGFRLERVRSYLVRGGGAAPPRGYLCMMPDRC